MQSDDWTTEQTFSYDPCEIAAYTELDAAVSDYEVTMTNSVNEFAGIECTPILAVTDLTEDR